MVVLDPPFLCVINLFSRSVTIYRTIVVEIFNAIYTAKFETHMLLMVTQESIRFITAYR